MGTMNVTSNVLGQFRAAVGDAFDCPYDRRATAKIHLEGLRLSRIRLSEFEKVAHVLGADGGAFRVATPNAAELFMQLTQEERADLERHLADRVKQLREDFPDLVEEYPYQFS
jgi:hypothetical protein